MDARTPRWPGAASHSWASRRASDANGTRAPRRRRCVALNDALKRLLPMTEGRGSELRGQGEPCTVSRVRSH